MKKIDYYEFLQISPNADQDTIHRVYRFLAARFHPDNPASGNAGTFSTLTEAYTVLSDPDRRAEYDAACAKETPSRIPLSNSIDFMDNLEGETNRRLGVLAVLYYRRRTNPHSPEVPLQEIESRMGFPRDYLDFTTWYLLRKGYITRADNSDFTLTAQGVDFVETQRVNIPVLNRLLTNGAESSVDAQTPAVNTPIVVPAQAAAPHAPEFATPINRFNGTQPAASNGLRLNGRLSNGAHHSVSVAEDRRVGTGDRRGKSQDRRARPTERRSGS